MSPHAHHELWQAQAGVQALIQACLELPFDPTRASVALQAMGPQATPSVQTKERFGGSGTSMSLVSVAVHRQLWEAAEWLVRHGADTRHPDPQGHTPVFYLLRRSNQQEHLRDWLAWGGDTQQLGQAIEACQLMQFDPIPALELLVGHGARVDAVEHASRTSRPLLAAYLCKSVEACQWLLDQGANPMRGGKNSPLNQARASYGSLAKASAQLGQPVLAAASSQMIHAMEVAVAAQVRKRLSAQLRKADIPARALPRSRL